MNEKLIEINNSILNTIHKQDEKITSLFTATGIIFGLSSFLISVYVTKTNTVQLIFIYILSGLYLLTFLLLVVLFSATIFPRRKTNDELNNKLLFNHYSEDIYSKIGDSDFNVFLSTESSNEIIIDQIKINTRIAHRKENLIIASVITTIAFSALLIILIVLALI